MRTTTQNDRPATSAELRLAERDRIEQRRGLKPASGLTPGLRIATRPDGIATSEELRQGEKDRFAAREVA